MLAMIDWVEVAGSDETVRVIHLCATGDHFCSGFDLGLRQGKAADPRAGAIQRRMRWHASRVIPAILETQTPVVASVQGMTSGLGFTMALASDFVIAADDTQFWAPYTGGGFTPDGGLAWMLPRLVGVTHTKDILMLGRKVTGTEAEAWGMIYQCVPRAELSTTVDTLLERVGSAATIALGLTKFLVHRGLGMSLDQHMADEGFAMELAARSNDFKEAGRALRDKRKPDFQGL